MSVYLGTIYLGGERLMIFELINNALLVVFRIAGLPAFIAYLFVFVVIEGADGKVVAISATVGEAYAIVPALMLIARSAELHCVRPGKSASKYLVLTNALGAIVLFFALLLLLYTARNVNFFSDMHASMYGQILVSVTSSFVVTALSVSLVGMLVVRCVSSAMRRLRTDR